jgi:hypothetical protein
MVAPVSTSTTQPALPTCRADQLVIGYRGSQGATGNWVSGFEVVDTSPTACALPDEVIVQLLDQHEVVQRSATWTSPVALELSANASMPPQMENPLPHQQLAWLTLWWPTEADAALEQGSTSGYCLTPLFTPAAVRFEFEGLAPITVTDLVGDPNDVGSLCGPDFSVYGG